MRSPARGRSEARDGGGSRLRTRLSGQSHAASGSGLAANSCLKSSLRWRGRRQLVGSDSRSRRGRCDKVRHLPEGFDLLFRQDFPQVSMLSSGVFLIPAIVFFLRFDKLFRLLSHVVPLRFSKSSVCENAVRRMRSFRMPSGFRARIVSICSFCSSVNSRAD